MVLSVILHSLPYWSMPSECGSHNFSLTCPWHRHGLTSSIQGKPRVERSERSRPKYSSHGLSRQPGWNQVTSPYKNPQGNPASCGLDLTFFLPGQLSMHLLFPSHGLLALSLLSCFSSPELPPLTLSPGWSLSSAPPLPHWLLLKHRLVTWRCKQGNKNDKHGQVSMRMVPVGTRKTFLIPHLASSI